MGPAIVVVGSLNADLCVRVPRFPTPGETIAGHGFTVVPGGKGANQACAAGRLGGRVAMAGQVGGDAQGRMLRDSLRRAHVDVSLVSVDGDEPTGVAVITVDAWGENEIVLAPGANATFTAGRLEGAEAVIRGARVVLLQLEIPMDTVLRAAATARAAGVRVVLDPAPAVPVSDELLGLADIVTPNEGELARLVGAAAHEHLPEPAIDAQARALLARGCAIVIVKMGARGARLVTADDARTWPSFPVTAVDTTAAGDAFNGALAVALADERALGDAMRFATAAGALSVTRHGAQPSMPARADVERLLATAR